MLCFGITSHHAVVRISKHLGENPSQTRLSCLTVAF